MEGHSDGPRGGAPNNGDGRETQATAPEALATGPIAPEEIFETTKSFGDLGLRSSVLKGVEAAGFKSPTFIQASMIPLALAGRDILGQAKTGTGKTAAFGLPLYHMATRELAFQTLILAPTRELAMQISKELEELGKFTPIRVAAIYGGQRISAQTDKLRKDPEILVGTPGRVMDLLERRIIHFRNIKFVVLDEVDRMLDIGFREDIRRILSQCPKDRQTIFVSATIGGEIEKLARQYMRDPEKLVISAGSLTVSLVKQYHLPVQPWDKRRLLKHLLTHEEPALTLVFCRLKRVCDELERFLRHEGIDAHAIHADLGQGKRNEVMAKLRAGQLEVLIASDLASRGIDVDGITHVINYDLPDDSDLYVHRIGRTARAGRGGVAWSFVTPDQGDLLTKIEHLINTEVPKLDYPDFTPGPVPDFIRKDQEAKRQSDASKTTRLVAMTQKIATAMSTPDPKKFPGGVMPSKLPPKRMFGRMHSSRGR
ncbi:MAG: DEAD/DEAH box helicase [Phycisphaerales bacterium]